MAIAGIDGLFRLVRAISRGVASRVESEANLPSRPIPADNSIEKPLKEYRITYQMANAESTGYSIDEMRLKVHVLNDYALELARKHAVQTHPRQDTNVIFLSVVLLDEVTP